MKNKKFRSFFYDFEQSKYKEKNCLYVLGVFMLLCFTVSLYFRVTKPDATVQKTYTKIDSSVEVEGNLLDQDMGSLISKSKQEIVRSKPKVSAAIKREQAIEYKAQQVISRGDEFDSSRGLPTGFEVTGKLLTGIDTREKTAVYKVLLPYGANFRGGEQVPNNTILLATAKYSGKGSKIYLGFTGGVFPDGREFKVSGQALDPKTKQPGVEGEFHSKAGARLAQTLGLSMISGAAEILVEKEQIGSNEGGAVSPKSTWKNAAYSGLSKATQLESERQLSEMSSEPEYATVDAGCELIVSLTSRLQIGVKE